MLKDSGMREEMSTGAVRDLHDGKPRPDLIPPSTILHKAIHFGEGAEKYGDNNWRRGIPVMLYWASAWRHLVLFGIGLTDEPHLRAASWNIDCMQWTLDAIACGMLPKELDDRPDDMKEDNPMGRMLHAAMEADRQRRLDTLKAKAVASAEQARLDPDIQSLREHPQDPEKDLVHHMTEFLMHEVIDEDASYE
jgi:hypothetical protein